MCALGLYLAFLLLENMIVSNNTTNSTNTHNPDIAAAYNIFRKDMLKHRNITRRSIGKQNDLNTTRKRWLIRKSIPEQSNMNWRKSKFLDNMNNIRTTNRQTNGTVIHKHIPLTLSTPLPYIQTTSSKIEFYYLDEKQLTLDETHPTSAKDTSSPPFLIFHLKGPFIDPFPMSSLERLNHSRSRNDQVRISGIRLKEVRALPAINEPMLALKETLNTVTVKTARPSQSSLRKKDFFDSNALMKRAIPPPPTLNKINIVTASSKNYYSYVTKSSTIYDKIKFFEIYDRYTRVPDTENIEVNNTDILTINLINNEKILLEHLNQESHDQDQAKRIRDQAKHVKDETKLVQDHAKHMQDQEKHVQDQSKHISELLVLNGLPIGNAVAQLKTLKKNETHETVSNDTSYFMNEVINCESNNSKVPFYVSETVRWSEHPFTAVYIYEPAQVHCDAAAINTHWLIASGSCLSRVSGIVEAPFEQYGESQSAFVTYCGELWWKPERVAYVKYTVVHPRYNPRDKTRQHLYNIGAIQVVNSMAFACAGWAPMPLMSHQFVANAASTEVTAIGWGLDRFDTRYGATDLPRTPLMLYKSVVYFDSCPGNTGYSKAKGLEERGGVSNVHCLSLPPYHGEDADPVHGGLLLANGKFIAFYLQEERRLFGEQCAQYTGVWRLIPWLMEVAKEPDEIDGFMFEL